jgi:hypothetical protein
MMGIARVFPSFRTTAAAKARRADFPHVDGRAHSAATECASRAGFAPKLTRRKAPTSVNVKSAWDPVTIVARQAGFRHGPPTWSIGSRGLKLSESVNKSSFLFVDYVFHLFSFKLYANFTAIRPEPVNAGPNLALSTLAGLSRPGELNEHISENCPHHDPRWPGFRRFGLLRLLSF